MDNMQYDRVDDKQFEEEYVNIQLRSDGLTSRIPISGMPEEAVKLAYALKALLESNRAERQRFIRCQTKGKDFNCVLDGKEYTMRMTNPEADSKGFAAHAAAGPPINIMPPVYEEPIDKKQIERTIEEFLAKDSDGSPFTDEACRWVMREALINGNTRHLDGIREAARTNTSYRFEYKGETVEMEMMGDEEFYRSVKP